jgi:hypothetical protein
VREPSIKGSTVKGGVVVYSMVRALDSKSKSIHSREKKSKDEKEAGQSLMSSETLQSSNEPSGR